MLFNLMLKCRHIVSSPKFNSCELHQEMLEFYSAIYTGIKEA